MQNENDPNNPNIIKSKFETNQPLQKRQAGTGFTNINRILGANVGAGQKLAGRISGSIEEQSDRVRKELDKAREKFQTGFQQARQGAQASISAGESLAKQPGENDEDYEKRIAEQSSNFEKIGQGIKSASYTGPTGFENPNVLLSQAQKAGKLGTFTRSGLGQGILARQYGATKGAAYGTGQNILDQMFLSQDPTAQKSLIDARQNVANLNQEITGATGSAQETAQMAQKAVEANKNLALENIRKSAEGVLTRGSQSAEEFNKQIGDINRLLMGVDEAGNPITSINPQQQELLNRMSDYGLGNYELYTSGRAGLGQNDLSGLFKQLAAGAVLNPSTAINLSDTQKQALLNLADVQGDPSLRKRVMENVFNKNVYKRDIAPELAQLKTAKEQDLKVQDFLNRYADYLDARSAANVDMSNLAEWSYKKNLLNKEWAELIKPTEYSSGLDNLNTPFARFSWAPDINLDDPDPKKGLSSQKFREAANKAVGSSKTIKDIILERIAKNRGDV